MVKIDEPVWMKRIIREPGAGVSIHLPLRRTLVHL